MRNKYNSSDNSFFEYQFIFPRFDYQVKYIYEIQLSSLLIDRGYEKFDVKANKDRQLGMQQFQFQSIAILGLELTRIGIGIDWN